MKCLKQRKDTETLISMHQKLIFVIVYGKCQRNKNEKNIQWFFSNEYI